MKSKILELVKKQESEILEFKPSLSQIKDIIEMISAFSNTKGGSIIIGVDDKRDIIGVDVGKKTIEGLANEIKQNTDPPIYPSISVEDIDGKNVIVVEVKESKSKPVFAFDRVYKRVGKSNHRVSSNEIRKMALEGKKIYWDEQICEEASLEDIDKGKVKRFLEKARFERRLDITPNISVREALERLNLIKSNRLTNAAILLFGKNPQKFFL
jgi:ATP-dependent DNA helicase RecG